MSTVCPGAPLAGCTVFICGARLDGDVGLLQLAAPQAVSARMRHTARRQNTTTS
jgi:hypothetical protein